MVMRFVGAFLLALICGSIPFSVLTGYLLLHIDIRKFGDGNPGATNAFRAGGWRIGLLALLLDFSKGLIPVSLARWQWGINGGALLVIAMAPLIGHHFSPFLRFRGGKAVATTFGIWSALTLWEGPIVLGIVLALLYWFQSSDGWSVIIGATVSLLYWVVRGVEPAITGFALANLLFLFWTHRHALNEPIKLRRQKTAA